MKYTMIVLVLAGGMLTGCRSKPVAGMTGSNDPFGVTSIDDGAVIEDNRNYPQEGDRSVFRPVYFDYDSSQVKSSESGGVEVVAKSLKKGECKGVIVEGHADERGSREYNLALGETRALAVRDYLISLGVDAAAVHTKSYGEESPEDSGHDEAAWRNNRRAAFAVY